MKRELKFREYHDSIMRHFELYNAYVMIDVNNVMQYTGLKDKNGKEIYEGDICNGRYGKFIVTFADCGFYPLCGDINAETNPKLIEIIGNIYENTKML